MDENVLADDVHTVNVLTVIASESYDSFAKGLQSEIAEAVSDRPLLVDTAFLIENIKKNDYNTPIKLSTDTALAIYEDLFQKEYVKKGKPTDRYFEDKQNGTFHLAPKLSEYTHSVIQALDLIYKPQRIENARKDNVTVKLRESMLSKEEFQQLWKRINAKTTYLVDFESEELIQNSIRALNEKLVISKIGFKVETGTMESIESKNSLLQGNAFKKNQSSQKEFNASVNQTVKYDLIDGLQQKTELTGKTLVAILKGIRPEIFRQFIDNPEEFIIKSSLLINEEKASAVIEHITYHELNDKYDVDIFTESTLRGRLDENAMKTKKHLYDHLIYDSENERNFASALDIGSEVALYVKLPRKFYITTPLGNYNPD